MKYAYIILAIVAAFGGGNWLGWELRGDHEKAIQSDEKDKIVAEWQAKVAKEKKVGDDTLVALEAERRNIKTVTVEVIKQIPKVTTNYVEVQGEPLKIIPPAIFTNGFVRLWNNALFAGQLSYSLSELTDEARGTDQVRAKIDSPDILANATENFAKYADCRAQLNKLIDWHTAMNAKTPQ